MKGSKPLVTSCSTPPSRACPTPSITRASRASSEPAPAPVSPWPNTAPTGWSASSPPGSPNRFSPQPITSRLPVLRLRISHRIPPTLTSGRAGSSCSRQRSLGHLIFTDAPSVPRNSATTIPATSGTSPGDISWPAASSQPNEAVMACPGCEHQTLPRRPRPCVCSPAISQTATGPRGLPAASGAVSSPGSSTSRCISVWLVEPMLSTHSTQRCPCCRPPAYSSCQRLSMASSWLSCRTDLPHQSAAACCTGLTRPPARLTCHTHLPHLPCSHLPDP